MAGRLRLAELEVGIVVPSETSHLFYGAGTGRGGDLCLTQRLVRPENSFFGETDTNLKSFDSLRATNYYDSSINSPP